MKRFNFYLFFFILLIVFPINIFSYDANDHMYMTYEAYYMLKLQNHCFPQME